MSKSQERRPYGSWASHAFAPSNVSKYEQLFGKATSGEALIPRRRRQCPKGIGFGCCHNSEKGREKSRPFVFLYVTAII